MNPTPITHAAREAAEKLRTTAGFGYYERNSAADELVKAAIQSAIDQARAADQKVIEAMKGALEQIAEQRFLIGDDTDDEVAEQKDLVRQMVAVARKALQ